MPEPMQAKAAPTQTAQTSDVRDRGEDHECS